MVTRYYFTKGKKHRQKLVRVAKKGDPDHPLFERAVAHVERSRRTIKRAYERGPGSDNLPNLKRSVRAYKARAAMQNVR